MEVLDFSQGNSFDGKIDFEEEEEDYQKYVEFSKEKNFYLMTESKEMDYDMSCVLTNVHWGQLKLFLSEFFTFVYHIDKDIDTVLYIGAANGSHIYVLAKLFSNITFHLYDTERFDKRLFSMRNVKIYKRYFAEEDIKQWKKRENFFLISDVRTLSYNPDSETDDVRIKNETSVWGDMKLQESWIETLKPSLSLIKFRLPFAYDFILKEGKTRKYLNGDVCYQVYNKPTSSETRLLVKDISYKAWDIQEYEKKMYYHNCITRNKIKFVNPLNKEKSPIYPEKGLFNDFDSTYFTVVVMDFLKLTGKDPTVKNTKEKIDFILNHITSRKVNLNSKRAGF